ncbi:hypothetical protein CDAR_457431 [Caerostris darwini]|uniref:Uncharacterized protein n=1 Tax=Caerostris darwini TaxID=1538125 RepID=A0AAV4PBM5_9ARAC|nr:hypothetical protein CDAR_457431 [Caerostris darwini]
MVGNESRCRVTIKGVPQQIQGNLTPDHLVSPQQHADDKKNPYVFLHDDSFPKYFSRCILDRIAKEYQREKKKGKAIGRKKEKKETTFVEQKSSKNPEKRSDRPNQWGPKAPKKNGPCRHIRQQAASLRGDTRPSVGVGIPLGRPAVRTASELSFVRRKARFN